MDAARHQFHDLWNERLHAVDGLNDVGARLLRDVEQDGRFLAIPGGEALRRHAVDDLTEVAQMQHAIVAGRHDQVAVLFGGGDLPVDEQSERAVRSLNAADRLGDVGIADGLADRLRGKATEVGFSCTRTAGLSAPISLTSATPVAWESRCARMVSTAS